MEGIEVLSIPTMTTVTLELIKKIVRNFKKDPTFDFPVEFYAALLPLVNLLYQILFGVLGWDAPVAIDIQSVIKLAVSSVLTIMIYNLGIKPLKEYQRYQS